MTEKNISEFHPLADIFPMMPEEPFKQFCADIEENGLINPIWIFQGKIIDGRNRYYACLETHTEMQFREFEGEEKDLLSFIVSLNLERRHLNESQRSMVAASLANLKHGQRADIVNQDASIDASAVTQKEAAKLLNVSRSGVQRAKYVQEHAIEDIKQRVEKGELSVSQAEKISRLSRGEQIKISKRGGGGALIDRNARAKVNKILKKAKSINDICVLCNPEIEISDESILVFLNVLKKRVGAPYNRLAQSMIEDILDMQIGEKTDTLYELVFKAIDSGLNTEADISKHTGIDRKTLNHLLEVLCSSKVLEIIPQGGKTEMARGGRKKLYRRLAENEDVSEEELDMLLDGLED